MKKIALITLFIALFLAACTPSEAAILTAIAETEAAKPTETFTVLPTSTGVSASTPSPTLTSTPTITPSSTPTATATASPTPDIQIIIGDPEDYILQKEDLPVRFILYAGDSTPHNNSEIISVRGIENGKGYLDATGRKGGWIIYYGRDDNTAVAPEWIRSYIVMYDSVEGPEIAKSPEWDWLDDDEEVVDIAMDLGDWNRVKLLKERQSSGKFYVIYAIEFHYRNVWAEVRAWGWESEIRHEFIEDAARVVLERLQNAPLAKPLTLDP
ncbi:MAG: hypothetical protein ISS57_12595 [Anaerolineales bacterium]|nr:hypothetical protein [Anaerolineales bacterium]